MIVYTFFVVLGEGSFGTVYLVKRLSDGKFYALKKVSFLSILIITENKYIKQKLVLMLSLL